MQIIMVFSYARLARPLMRSAQRCEVMSGCRRVATLLHLSARHVRDRRHVVRRCSGAGVGSSPVLRRRRPVLCRDRQLDVEVGRRGDGEELDVATAHGSYVGVARRRRDGILHCF